MSSSGYFFVLVAMNLCTAEHTEDCKPRRCPRDRRQINFRIRTTYDDQCLTSAISRCGREVVLYATLGAGASQSPEAISACTHAWVRGSWVHVCGTRLKASSATEPAWIDYEFRECWRCSSEEHRVAPERLEGSERMWHTRHYCTGSSSRRHAHRHASFARV